MAEPPPREGARWGLDPTPVSIPQPEGPPPEYVRLCDIYGQPNVERAIEIYGELKHKYPHVEAVKWSPIQFATVALDCAHADVKRAAEDGRAHSLPEALDNAHKVLGAFLVVNETSTSWTIPFGDEGQGRAARAAKFKADERQTLIIFSILGFAVAVGIFWYLTSVFLFAIIITTLMIIAGAAVAIFIRWARNVSAKTVAFALAIPCIALGKTLSSHFSVRFNYVIKHPGLAYFSLNNNTLWEGQIVIWSSTDGGSNTLCPQVSYFRRFSDKQVRYDCASLKGDDYKIFADWATKKPDLAKVASPMQGP